MNWNKWIRQFHRWVSIAFTVTVIANFVAMAVGKPPDWLVYSPLAPLFLLLFTGLYMFVLPYVARCGAAREAPAHTHEGQEHALGARRAWRIPSASADKEGCLPQS